MAEIAAKYGVTRQAVYMCIKKDDERKSKRAKSDYPSDVFLANKTYLDEETGMSVAVNGTNQKIILRMGDEKVSAFVRYHMEMLGMRQGVDKRDVRNLCDRFYNYLEYCAEHGIIPSNMNCYFAMGVSRQDIDNWKNGKGTPEQQEFALMIKGFFASVHEQAATDGVMNPIFAMWLQKAHDHMIEASKAEANTTDLLGERKSAEDIAKAYEDVNLPD